MARLRGYLLYLSATPEPERGEKLWSQIRDETQRLIDGLAAEPGSDAELPDSTALVHYLDTMHQLLENRARELVKLGAPARHQEQAGEGLPRNLETT